MLEFYQTFLANRLLSLLQSELIAAARATIAWATVAKQFANYLLIVAAK